MTAPESPRWFKSSYSGSNGGSCVEVAWFKSSYSSSNSGECVEIAFTGPAVGIRDTKDRAAGHLTVSGPAWDALLGHALSNAPAHRTGITLCNQ